jgi:hypothetical protein
VATLNLAGSFVQRCFTSDERLEFKSPAEVMPADGGKEKLLFSTGRSGTGFFLPALCSSLYEPGALCGYFQNAPEKDCTCSRREQYRNIPGIKTSGSAIVANDLHVVKQRRTLPVNWQSAQVMKKK